MAVLVTLLERRADEPPSPEALEGPARKQRAAQELIDGALEYASVGELRRERVGLELLFAEVAEDLAPALEEAGAALEVDGDLPEVDADPRQLRRVLQNLVGNAIKFRGEAPPRVALSARRDREEWVVTVREDNGVGVDPKDASRIFGLVLQGQGRRGRRRHRPRGLPAGDRGPRRADLGRAGRGRRQRLPLHASSLTAAFSSTSSSRSWRMLSSPSRRVQHASRSRGGAVRQGQPRTGQIEITRPLG